MTARVFAAALDYALVAQWFENRFVVTQDDMDVFNRAEHQLRAAVREYHAKTRKAGIVELTAAALDRCRQVRLPDEYSEPCGSGSETHPRPDILGATS